MVLYTDRAPQGKSEVKGYFHSATPGCITVTLKRGQTRTLGKQAVYQVLVDRLPYEGLITAGATTGIFLALAPRWERWELNGGSWVLLLGLLVDCLQALRFWSRRRRSQSTTCRAISGMIQLLSPRQQSPRKAQLLQGAACSCSKTRHLDRSHASREPDDLYFGRSFWLICRAGPCMGKDKVSRAHDMKWRRYFGILAVFLAISGNMLGSEPEKRLQARWSQLKKLINGNKVALQPSDGARVKGRVLRVTEASLVLTNYPKGKIEIARETVFRIEALDFNVNLVARRARKDALTVGAAVGALVGTVALFLVAGPDEGSGTPVIWGGIAIGAGVAVLMNLPQRSRDVTLIEILLDSPGERKPKSTNKDQSSTPTNSGEALAGSIIE